MAQNKEAREEDEGSYVPCEISFWNNRVLVLKRFFHLAKKISMVVV